MSGTSRPAARPAAAKANQPVASSASRRKPAAVREAEARSDALQKELDELKAKLAQQAANAARAPADDAMDAETAQPKVIETLHRPPGEAGSKKRGFKLQDAMGLAGKRTVYKDIQRGVKHNCNRVNLDASLDFAHQDVHKLAMVYKLGRQDFPYLTQKRFPIDWAQAELVKQYLRNVRKHEVKQGRMDTREERKKKRANAASAGGSSRLALKTATLPPRGRPGVRRFLEFSPPRARRLPPQATDCPCLHCYRKQPARAKPTQHLPSAVSSPSDLPISDRPSFRPSALLPPSALPPFQKPTQRLWHVPNSEPLVPSRSSRVFLASPRASLTSPSVFVTGTPAVLTCPFVFITARSLLPVRFRPLSRPPVLAFESTQQCFSVPSCLYPAPLVVSCPALPVSRPACPKIVSVARSSSATRSRPRACPQASSICTVYRRHAYVQVARTRLYIIL
ncbi:hypothetical protein MKEN_00179300 [Mycena kentingensis (nom. inval.)]|nr:hypothetical protein MKEN_00179300 [Mycena kentingensis (nom. inval.)]